MSVHSSIRIYWVLVGCMQCNRELGALQECNHHLALHAGALLASADGALKEKEVLSPEQALVGELQSAPCLFMHLSWFCRFLWRRSPSSAAWS